MVKGLPCWPDRPLYGQIVEGDELRNEKINLESFWTPWQDSGGTITLNAKEDFDHVVLGTSLGPIPFICKELIASNDNWKNMVANVTAVQTQSLQLWFKPDLKELGWSLDSPILGTYEDTLLDTWADMSDVIPHENWAEGEVKSIAYLTGPMVGPANVPPQSDKQFPAQAALAVNKVVLDFIDNKGHVFFPNAYDENGQFRWELLAAPDNITGADRLKYQFQRANIDPSERYVQSVVNSSQYRIKGYDPAEVGFAGLYLAGDWTNNIINMGCVEAATISGMQVSQAISGLPKVIVGAENDIW
jgi:uncharacterized protein with NAD-binding domain and iron-sulfur cluster